MMPRFLFERLFLRSREEVRGLADTTALQRDGAADVERPHLERPIPEHPRPQLRHHGPLLAHLQAAQPAVRNAAQQGQHGGLLELVLGALAQVGEELGVAPRIS